MSDCPGCQFVNKSHRRDCPAKHRITVSDHATLRRLEGSADGWTSDPLPVKTQLNEYYIITTRHRAIGPAGVLLFWGPNRSGYRTILEQAGRYTEAEAKDITELRGGDYMVPCHLVDQHAVRVVDFDKLHTLVPKAEPVYRDTTKSQKKEAALCQTQS